MAVFDSRRDVTMWWRHHVSSKSKSKKILFQVSTVKQ